MPTQSGEVEQRIRAVREKRTKKLDLSELNLRELPESIGRLTQLHSLHVQFNELTELPDWIGNLSELVYLDASRNQLTELPQSIGKLKRLQKLYLRRNRLKELPTLEELTQLQKLSVYFNDLTTLPDSLGQLVNLKELHVSDNQLTCLPSQLGNLLQLVVLNVAENRLKELPESVEQLTSLRQLYLHGNSSLGIPRERLGPTAVEVARGATPARPAEILEDYFSTRGGLGRALRELKLIVVGRGGIGKTSLIKRLNEKPLNPNEPETHGIVISRLELKCEDGPVTARVWDFGGQHVLHAMHEFFLTSRSLYLLVLGERDDMAEQDAAYWLQLIRSYAGRAPVVIALNKSKGNAREMDRATLNQNYGPIIDWVPTECDEQHADTIENLRMALTDAANTMPEVRARFKSKWWKIKQWLEQMPQPYLDFETYQKQCGELGESDPAEQEKLAKWLHDLGVALNYLHDPRLHNTTVLHPDWLANGIYALLRANAPNHPQKLAADAVLSASQLGPIYAASEKLGMLNAADYPSDKWSFLLRLMCLFQLAYPLDESGRMLVPTLLPVEASPSMSEPVNAQRLRYEFRVVPGPLIPRFLVRTFSLIDGKLCWRRGGMFRYADGRARVWSEEERWVHVSAYGPDDDRDALLTMIRETFSDLFGEYKGLHVVEQWEFEDQWVPRKALERLGVRVSGSQENVEP